MSVGLELAEKRKLPDFVIRFGIRSLLKKRLQPFYALSEEERRLAKIGFIEELKNSPIAVKTESANEQHYEVPTEFYLKALGKHLKYSSCFYETGKENLDDAEAKMLAITCERAELQNGQHVLE